MASGYFYPQEAFDLRIIFSVVVVVLRIWLSVLVLGSLGHSSIEFFICFFYTICVIIFLYMLDWMLFCYICCKMVQTWGGGSSRRWCGLKLHTTMNYLYLTIWRRQGHDGILKSSSGANHNWSGAGSNCPISLAQVSDHGPRQAISFSPHCFHMHTVEVVKRPNYPFVTFTH